MGMLKKYLGMLVVFLFTAVYYLWILLYNGSMFYRIFVSDVLQTVPPLIVFFLLLYTYKNDKYNKKSFWLNLCIGCGSYLISQLIWDFYEIILGIYNPALGWQSVFWAISAITYIYAVARELNEKKDGSWTWVLVVDTFTVMCIAFAVTWLYIIFPGINNQHYSDLFANALYLLYPAGNLVSLYVSVTLYLSLKHNDPERKTLYLVSLAFFTMYAANSIYAFLSVNNSYRSGSLMDPLWSLYVLIMGLACIEYNSLVKKEYDSPSNSSNEEYNAKALSLLPIASVILLFILMLFSRSKVVLVLSSISIFLITLRHSVIIVQNRQLITKLEHLNTNLECIVKERTHELYNMAFYDQLTGLPNRRLFEDNLKKVMEDAKRNNTSLALLFLDLDRFKTINDTLGHSFGDMLLKEVAERIKICLDSYYIISRQGGDEFAIIVEGYENEQEIAEIAKRILSELIKPVELLNHYAYTTCSIGIALLSPHNSDPQTLMRHADAAMYRSKELGKNTYQFYDPEMDILISRKLIMERDLRRALENNEFVLFFQPQVNAINGRITGAEALIRWMNPAQGIVPPSDFIPLAEETGMIDMIGNWVLKSACLQAKKWQTQGFKPLKIGVNISPYQLQQENFVSLVDQVLKETGLQPDCLNLEITESISIQNESDIIFKLHKLKKIGVSISIDDFGTGYSSLNYLNRLPISTLKIAQQFVKNIKNDSSSKAIVSAIIAIAKNLKLNVIAEGVENEYQLNFLKSQSCAEMQGFFFSKPLPSEMFMEFMKKDMLTSTLR